VGIKILQLFTKSLTIFGILILLVSAGIYGLLKSNWNLFDTEALNDLPSGYVGVTPTPEVAPTPVTIQTAVESIYNENLSYVSSDNVIVPEVSYFERVVDKLVRSWNGSEEVEIRLSIKDFTDEDLSLYREGLVDSEAICKIPESLQPRFLTPESQNAVSKTMQSARNEYLLYLKAREVNQAYISELESNTIDSEDTRLAYTTTLVPSDCLSYTDFIRDERNDVINNDFSKLRIVLTAQDVAYTSSTISQSKILATDNLETTRDIAVRLIIYKQMTFGLERAVDTVNAPDKNKKDRDSYQNATKSMRNIGIKHSLSWGGVLYDKSQNAELILRMQSNMIGNEILQSVYKFSDVQKEIFNDFFIERFLNSGQKLVDSVNNFNKAFPKYPIMNLETKLVSDFIAKQSLDDVNKRAILLMNSSLDFLANNIADKTILTSDEMKELWEYLR